MKLTDGIPINCLNNKNSTCTLCLSNVVLPIEFKCGHDYCMKCFFNDTEHNSQKKCFTCGSQRTTNIANPSPIFKLNFNVNMNELYSCLANGALIQTSNKENLSGKQIVITKDFDLTDTKGTIFRQTIVGNCLESNNDEFTLQNGFVIDRNNMKCIKMYPIYPTIRTFKFQPDDVLYFVV